MHGLTRLDVGGGCRLWMPPAMMTMVSAGLPTHLSALKEAVRSLFDSIPERDGVVERIDWDPAGGFSCLFHTVTTASAAGQAGGRPKLSLGTGGIPTPPGTTRPDVSARTGGSP